jgi:hypothetical protein
VGSGGLSGCSWGPFSSVYCSLSKSAEFPGCCYFYVVFLVREEDNRELQVESWSGVGARALGAGW